MLLTSQRCVIRALAELIVLLNIYIHICIPTIKKCKREIIAVCSFPSSLWVSSVLVCPFDVWLGG